MNTLRLEDDKMCFVCGKANPLGFKLDFRHPSKGLLSAEVIFRKEHQGFKDLVHGGMIATLLDEMMVNLAWREGIPAVTAEMTTRLKEAVPVGKKVLLEGRLEKEGEKLLLYSASARGEDGRIYATATAKCLRIPGKHAILANQNK